MTAPALPQRRLWSRTVAIALWIALTVAVLTAARALPWQNAMREIARVHTAWLVLAVAANVTILVIWSAEWRLLAPAKTRPARATMFEIVSSMATVLNSIPFFAGEATGVALLIDRARMTRGAALSVLALDQLLSGLSKLLVLGVAAVMMPLPLWLRAGILALVTGVTLLCTVLLVMAHGWSAMRARLLERASLVRRAVARLVALGVYLEALRETHRASRLVALAIAKKGVELGAILAVQAAFGLDPSFAGGSLVLASISIATLAPVSPGNVGVYEAAVFASYRYAGISSDVALGMAVIQHACFLLPMLATGYVTLSVRQLARRSHAQ